MFYSGNEPPQNAGLAHVSLPKLKAVPVPTTVFESGTFLGQTFIKSTTPNQDGVPAVGSLLPIEQQPSQGNTSSIVNTFRKPAKRMTNNDGGSVPQDVKNQPSTSTYFNSPDKTFQTAQMLPLLSPGFNIQFVNGNNGQLLQLCVNSPEVAAHDEIIHAIQSLNLVVSLGSSCMVGRNMYVTHTTSR